MHEVSYVGADLEHGILGSCLHNMLHSAKLIWQLFWASWKVTTPSYKNKTYINNRKNLITQNVFDN